MNRRKVIIIHGVGGTACDAVRLLKRLLSLRVHWADGDFVLNRNDGQLLRRMLREEAETDAFGSLQNLLLARLFKSSLSPADAPAVEGTPATISESQIERDYPSLGMPVAPEGRALRAQELEEQAKQALADVFARLAELDAKVHRDGNELATELEAEEILQHAIADRKPGTEGLAAILDVIRSAQEGGGDLDTVTSAVLYTHYVKSQAAAEGRKCVFGRDYTYAYVNYHEGLKHLAEYGPADVLMADFPSGAIPDFEDDSRFLAEHEVFIERFEDHHPVSPGRIEEMDRLKEEGLLEYYAISGPVEGQPEEGVSPDELTCAADMVHGSCVKGQPWDNAGAETLRALAHSEDFVTERTEMGRTLTELIKGGQPKIRLVEVMIESIPSNDLRERIDELGWNKQVETWREQFEEVAEALLERAYVLKVRPQAGQNRTLGGRALGDGSDVPVARVGEGDHGIGDVRNVLMALAPKAKPGGPKIHVGKALHFYTRTFDDLDYVYYCYGSHLMVARRVNQADLSMNLGLMMPRLGGPGDGGHAGAAVARPDSNERYPDRLLGRVHKGNFRLFARYMGTRLEELGYEVDGVENRSSGDQGMGGKHKNIIITALVCLAIGIVLALFVPKFQRDKLIESNQDFMPQIEAAPGAEGGASAEAGETTEEEEEE